MNNLLGIYVWSDEKQDFILNDITDHIEETKKAPTDNKNQ